MAAIRDSKGRFISRAAQAAMASTVKAIASVSVPRIDQRAKYQSHEWVSPKKARSNGKRRAPVTISVFM